MQHEPSASPSEAPRKKWRKKKEGGGGTKSKKHGHGKKSPDLPAGCEVAPEDVSVLKSHTSEVFCCAW